MRKVMVTHDRRIRRKKRVSSKIKGTKEFPRVSVFRSNKNIYAQVIDDIKRHTLLSFSSLGLSKGKKKQEKSTKKEIAFKVGEELGKMMLKKGVKKAKYDRGRFSYKGRVKALAEGLRKAGIKI